MALLWAAHEQIFHKVPGVPVVRHEQWKGLAVVD